MKFRKKPIVIDAWKFTPGIGKRPPCICEDFGTTRPEQPVGYNPFVCELDIKGVKVPNGHAWVETLEGVMLAAPGDYIIRGIKGEYYPCKPDIFEASYEPISE